MNHLTLEEAIKLNTNPDPDPSFMNGYNTAVDEAEKEIQETTELANRSYNEGLMDGRLPIPGLEKEIAELKSALDTWINKYDQLVIQHNRDNSSQALPEHTIAELVKRIEKLKTSDEGINVLMYNINERLSKLESFGISDGSKIRIGSFTGTVTKIR